MTAQMVETLQPPIVAVDQPTASQRRAGTFIDGVAALITAALALMLATGAHVALRAPTALLFVVFVPGWTLIRLFLSRVTVLSFVGSIALSVSITIILGEATVLVGGWHWYPVGIVLTTACAAMGIASLFRPRAMIVDQWDGTVLETTAPAWVPMLCLASVIFGNDLVAVGLASSNPNDIGRLGVVDILSIWYWLGVAVIIAGLIIGCRYASRWAWCNVAGLVIALYGLPGMLEPNPRFSVAWIHVGFADHIADHGTLLTRLDARFSWAGFFAGAAFLQRLAGTESVLWLVRYAPVCFTGAAAVLIGLLARRLRATEAQAVVAAAIFCCLNWIGQDYFSPQATGFLLYLTVITVVLYVFPANPRMSKHRWLTRLLRPEYDDYEGVLGGHLSRAATVLALGGCYVMLTAMVVAHQLSPAFFISASVLLVVTNTTRLRTLPVVAVVLFLAWLSFGADAYWVGHFNELTGSVGRVGRLIDQNVSSRTQSTTLDRRIVVMSRFGLALFAWILGAVALVRRWMKRRTPVALLCLFVAPFPMLFLQPYGGEMALRVCYFTLPAASILIAKMLVPVRRIAALRLAIAAVLVALLVPVFITARYGNEQFELTTSDDIRVMHELYALAPAGSVVYVPSLQTLQYIDRVADVRFRNLPSGPAPVVTDRLDHLKAPTSVFLMFTEGQAAYGVAGLGRADDWLQVLANEYAATGRYEVRAQIGDSLLLELERR